MLLLSSLVVHGLASSALRATAWELHGQGKMMEAIQHMKAAVSEADVPQTARAPNDIAPRFDLACMWEDIGYLDEAEAGFSSLSAEHGQWKTYLANVLHDGRGQRQEALTLYRQACTATQNYIHEPTLLRQHSNAQYGRGVCAESLGLVDEAAACQRKVLELEPEDKSAAFHLLVNTERRLGSECSEMRTQLKDLLPQYRLDSWDYVRRKDVGRGASTHY